MRHGIFHSSAWWALLIFCFIAACDIDFGFSPYESGVDSDIQGLNARNLAALELSDTGSGQTFQFALISDIHNDYEALRKAVEALNNRNDIRFVVVCGDVTDMGMKTEFSLFHSIMQGLRFPYIVVIGNHDTLCNGKDIYRRMYGEFDFSFVYEKCKFIVLNSNALEFPGEAPDFDWLQSELADTSGLNHVIQIAHVPPKENDVFDGATADYWRAILEDGGVLLSLHGHEHDGWRYQQNGVRYYCTKSISNRTFDVITITNVFFDYRRCDESGCLAVP
ncbi:MAG: metallophosphoesterase family protein [Thermodesulfobacteriota bacterium]